MGWTPPKAVIVTSLGAGYAICSGCPGYMIALDQVEAHQNWHSTYGSDGRVVFAVTDLVAVATNVGTVTLRWQNPTPQAVMTTVTRDGVTEEGTPTTYSVLIPGHLTEQVFAGLADGTTYTFTVTPNGGQAASAQCSTPPNSQTTGTGPMPEQSNESPKTGGNQAINDAKEQEPAS